MTHNGHRRPWQAPGSGGEDYVSSDSANAITFPSNLKTVPAPLDQLTQIVTDDLLRRGKYPAAIVPWLLAGVRVQP